MTNWFVAFMIYIVTGLILVSVLGLIESIRLAIKYPDIFDELTTILEQRIKNSFGGDGTTKTMMFLIGLLVWPIRLAQSNTIFEELWETAEDLRRKHRLEKNES